MFSNDCHQNSNNCWALSQKYTSPGVLFVWKVETVPIFFVGCAVCQLRTYIGCFVRLYCITQADYIICKHVHTNTHYVINGCNCCVYIQEWWLPSVQCSKSQQQSTIHLRRVHSVRGSEGSMLFVGIRLERKGVLPVNCVKPSVQHKWVE